MPKYLAGQPVLFVEHYHGQPKKGVILRGYIDTLNGVNSYRYLVKEADNRSPMRTDVAETDIICSWNPLTQAIYCEE